MNIIDNKSFEEYFNNILLPFYKEILSLVEEVNISTDNLTQLETPEIPFDGIIRAVIPLKLKEKCEKNGVVYHDNYNKYNNIFPLPENMVNVELRSLNNYRSKTNKYYYNASYIINHIGKTCYIAAQGPIRGTLGFFYAMLYHDNINNVIMCTKPTENGISKCLDYLSNIDIPKNVSVLFDVVTKDIDTIIYEKFKVNKTIVKTMNGITHTEIRISSSMSNEIKIINHFYIDDWDDGRIISIEKFNDFFSYYHQFVDKAKLDLIHCSAGVGRTGVMIASLFKKYGDPRSIDDIIIDLRKQRTNMVQSYTQYRFLKDNFDFEIELKLFVKTICKDRDESHGFEHMVTVANTSKYIYENLILNKDDEILKIIMAVAYLHDVYDHKYDPEGKLIPQIKSFLGKYFNKNDNDIELILNIIDRISFSKEDKLIKAGISSYWTDVLDSKAMFIRDIVSDADKLDAIGKIGIFRCKIYSESKYPELSPKQINEKIIEHANEKLLRLKDEFIRTSVGKKLAEPLHEEMLIELDKIKNEFIFN